ncbi:rRNA-processing protein cgr1 [Elasticomyces elasticus]|nr:hypothetical protein LTR28_012373 [Elasticomyces elasticus]KAK4985744.1 rRNA-processing protein cgr1 [Elasticomyces elasticus]KAK4999553.1 rRNA-processing protein cgr1 [Elasticomyces elasticus]
MTEIKKYKVTEPFLTPNCGLGEAPFWETDTNTLRFVDILKKRLHTVDLNVGASSHKSRELPISIGTTADIEGSPDEFVFGGKLGYGIMNKKSGEWRWIKKMWTEAEAKAGKEDNLRSNDGAVDIKGRYWVGTMNDPPVKSPSDEGVVFRLDPDLSLHRPITSVTIPNGISWSLDNKTMYFTDSPSTTISTYPYDPESGEIDLSGKGTFFECPIEGGVPDGHAQDEEGCFWIALFGTGKVVRANKQGEVVAEIELPTRCVSCPGFAGEYLYITSAAEEDPEKYPDSAKLQGAVFRVNVGVRGCPLNKFRMDNKA